VTPIKSHLAANFFGRFYSAAVNLAFVPVYIGFIGIEGYGLIGFYATLQALFNLLDMGIANTLKRELAAVDDSVDAWDDAGDFLLTLQGLYLVIASLVCVAVFALSPVLARNWLSSESISTDTLSTVLVLFGVVVANRMTYGFYSGGLLGLQRQVLYNAQDALFVSFRAVGAVIVLWQVSSTVIAFFAWQVISGIVWTTISGCLLWRSLPARSRRARLRFDLLRDVWRFAAGLSINSILGILLNQVDKIALSKMLSLEMFGYYTLAGTVAASLQYFGTPVCTAYFPVFVRAISQGKVDELVSQYHKASQVIAVAIFPVAGVFIFLSRPLITAWTGNPTIANQAWLLTAILSLAMALNQLAALPYNLQLAWKQTRFSVVANVVAVIVLAPVLYLGIHFMGALGAAVVSVLLNLGYVIGFAQIVHRRFLVGEFLRWGGRDIAPAALAITATGTVAWFLQPYQTSKFSLIAYLLLAGSLMLVSAVLTADLIRKPLLDTIASRFKASRKF